MPYDGEFATYRPLHRIMESQRVKQLLSRSRVYQRGDSRSLSSPMNAPEAPADKPRFILAIDGSYSEVPVVTGYPGARVGYCTVASVLLDLALVDRLDAQRPVDPRRFRETEKAASIDAALPGSNVVTRRQSSACASFREELYDHFSMIIDEDDRIPLSDTYEALLAHKPASDLGRCPYHRFTGCSAYLGITTGHSECPNCKGSVYSTDALRIHERFNDLGSNGEAFGLVMQVWERILLIHLLRCFEKRKLLRQLSRVAFFVDGPLAVFGPPAWLSAAISKELKRINSLVRHETGNDLVILGIEKTGGFVEHFNEIDRMETPGETLFAPRTYLLLTDNYIKERIQQSSSTRRYGQDTYFGRKFFYKTATEALIVANIPFLNEEQDTLQSEDINLYPRFGTACSLLDNLACSRFPNSLSPLVSAHAQAAIPLHLGAKVLQQLAQVLMGEA